MYRFLSACAAAGLMLSGCNLGPKDGEVSLGGCVEEEVLGVCTLNQDESGANVAVLSITNDGARSGKRGSTGRLTVTPDFLCARPGELVRLEIAGDDTEKLRVGVLPARYRQAWLVGSNGVDRGEIRMYVPSCAEHDPDSVERKQCLTDVLGEYKYSVVTSEGSCIDPRVHVRN